MIERDFCVRKVSGGDSLLGFVRGLFGVLVLTRVCFWRDYFVFIPFLVGLKSNFEANWKLKVFADFFY